MPKMTRRDFTEAATKIWAQAIDNFEHAGFLAPVFLGYTAKGEEHAWMGTTHPDQDASDEEWESWQNELRKAERNGITLLTSAWRDNIDHLRAEVDRLGIVAGIHVDEAWVARDALAFEIASLGMATSAHPMKEEVIMLQASWPREYVSTFNMRLIHRDDHGHPTLVEVPDTAGMQSTGWVEHILPPPPGKPRPALPSLHSEGTPASPPHA